MRVRIVLATLFIVFLGVSAQGQRGPGRGGGGGGQGRGGRGGGGGIAMPVVLTASAWTDGGDIPSKYAGQTGVSPALTWTAGPAGTQSFVLIMHDMDVAPQKGEDVLHFIIWDIPGTATGLPEGLQAGDQADGSRIGRNIAGQNSYMGPAPPAGHPVHHYVLELYALDNKLGLPATATRAEVMAAMNGHIVSRGAYYGKFKPA